MNVIKECLKKRWSCGIKKCGEPATHIAFAIKDARRERSFTMEGRCKMHKKAGDHTLKWARNVAKK